MSDLSSGSINELEYAPQAAASSNPLSAGLPEAWWPCIWGIAALVYGSFWMTESWSTAKPLLGPTRINHLTQDLWSLLVTIVACCALYQFYKRRSQTLGILLTVIVAALAMMWHRL